MSQAELASKANLQPSAISHFETGQREPSFDNLKKVADALQVTTDYLMGRVEEPNLSSPSAVKLFRKVSNLSEDELGLLEAFAETLAKRSQKKKDEE